MPYIVRVYVHAYQKIFTRARIIIIRRNNYDGLKSKFCTFYILLPVLSNVCSILNLKNNILYPTKVKL